MAWRNRDEAGYAWRILRDGVCDGCALGTSGLRDWTLDGVHLCMVRLDLLRLNTMPALDPAVLADAEALAARGSTALRGLGRLAHPMLRRAGEPGFRRIGWPEATDIAASRLAEVRQRDPTRAAGAPRSRSSTPIASPASSATGCRRSLERPVRHRPCPALVRRRHRRRPRLPERHDEGPARSARRRRARLRRALHRGLRRGRGGAERNRLVWSSRATPCFCCRRRPATRSPEA